MDLRSLVQVGLVHGLLKSFKPLSRGLYNNESTFPIPGPNVTLVLNIASQLIAS